MRSRSCIIRSPLDNMFRNTKQFSSSASYAASTSQGFGPSIEPAFSPQDDASLLPPPTSNAQAKAAGCGDDLCSILRVHAVEDHDEYALPKCMQFMDASDRVQHAPQVMKDTPNYLVTSSCGAPRLADFEDAKQAPSLHGHISPKEIHEYDFLRCIDEDSGAAPDEVDCTLHLGRASAIPNIRNRNAAVLEGMLDAATASKQHVSDNTSMPSFDSAPRNISLCQWDYGHLDKREIKDNTGSMPWSSGLGSMWRAHESVGMSRLLLRENAHDIEECENSSRTSSNSSGTTIKTSAIVSDNPIMYTYNKSRDRDYSAAAAAASFSSNQWFQYNDQGSFAGSLSNTRPLFSMRENDRDSYLSSASAILSSYAGALPPHVLSGTKSSNAKEGSNNVIRICAQCKTMRTPLWRNGPQGPKSLCNACGIRYKKEERRSAAVEDSKQEANCADQRSRFNVDPSEDQRPRSNMDDQRARSSMDHTEDQRSRLPNEDRRSRLPLGTSEDQRSRFIREDRIDLNEDRRSRFSMDPSDDQRQRIIDSGDRRPRLVDGKQIEKRPKLD